MSIDKVLLRSYDHFRTSEGNIASRTAFHRILEGAKKPMILDVYNASDFPTGGTINSFVQLDEDTIAMTGFNGKPRLYHIAQDKVSTLEDVNIGWCMSSLAYQNHLLLFVSNQRLDFVFNRSEFYNHQYPKDQNPIISHSFADSARYAWSWENKIYYLSVDRKLIELDFIQVYKLREGSKGRVLESDVSAFSASGHRARFVLQKTGLLRNLDKGHSYKITPSDLPEGRPFVETYPQTNMKAFGKYVLVTHNPFNSSSVNKTGLILLSDKLRKLSTNDSATEELVREIHTKEFRGYWAVILAPFGKHVLIYLLRSKSLYFANKAEVNSNYMISSILVGGHTLLIAQTGGPTNRLRLKLH